MATGKIAYPLCCTYLETRPKAQNGPQINLFFLLLFQENMSGVSGVCVRFVRLFFSIQEVICFIHHR